MRQVVIASPQPNSTFQSSIVEPSASSYTATMIKSLQALKSVMVNRYRLDPNRSATETYPRFPLDSQEDTQELLNLADYAVWLGKCIKNNILLSSSNN